MDLDDMKLAWTRMEQRLDRLETLAFDTLRDRKLDASRSALRRVGASDIFRIALWIAFVAFVAPFWIHHRATPHLLIAGLVLHAYGIAVICFSVVRLLLVGRLYYAGPIVVMQRQLVILRRFRTRSELLLGLPWWLLWVPAAMVAAMSLAHIDLYLVSPAWVYGSLAVGALGLGLSLWLARWLAHRPIRSPWLQSIVDSLTGHSLARAARELDKLASFARD